MNLKEHVAAVVGASPRRDAVIFLVNESRRIALAYLYQKVRRRSLQPDFFGLSLDDLALDCVADLYQRDEQGCYVQLTTYFGSISWEEMDEADVAIAFRRLVFSKLNEGLFRRYGEMDASLAKLIRNTKNAVKGIPDLRIERSGEPHLICTTVGETLNGLPLAPNEILEAYFTAHLHRCNGLQEAISLFIAFVEHHPHYSNGYPLSALAQVLRSAYVRIGRVEEEETQQTGPLPFEIKGAIERATDELQREMYPSYVGRGKVDRYTFGIYFCAIRDILAYHFISNQAYVGSYFEALQAYLPGLDKAGYGGAHRNVLEYLTTLCRARLVLHLTETSTPRRAYASPRSA